MDCPACGHGLSPVTTEGITVDACVDGCGGLWFDRFELTKVDEAREAAGEALLSIPRKPGHAVDRDRRYGCPKCPGVVMMRYHSSARRQVTVDECPTCGGTWLDEGELEAIRSEFASQAEREQHDAAYLDEVLAAPLAAARAESAAKLERAQRFAKLFRFICPSFYLRGEQSWGAF